MEKEAIDKNDALVCNLSYLAEMTRENKTAMLEIMNVFTKQILEELHSINEAVTKTNYPTIKQVAHTIKSTVSVVGITVLKPILMEMENLSGKAEGIEKITILNEELNTFCKQAITEIEHERLNYI